MCNLLLGLLPVSVAFYVTLGGFSALLIGGFIPKKPVVSEGLVFVTGIALIYLIVVGLGCR